MTTQREGAKWRQDDSADDAPRQQPMRAGLKPAQRKAPTQDQKKVRRQMAKSAFLDDLRRCAHVSQCPECHGGSASHDESHWHRHGLSTHYLDRIGNDYVARHRETGQVGGRWTTEGDAIQSAHGSAWPDPRPAGGWPEEQQKAASHTARVEQSGPPCPECGTPGKDEGGMGATTFGHVETPGHCRVYTWTPQSVVVARDVHTKAERDAMADAFDARLRSLNPFSRGASVWEPETQTSQPQAQPKLLKVKDRTEFQPRDVPDDSDFDPYLVKRCPDHGSSVVSDRESQSHYLPVVIADHDHAMTHGDREHRAACHGDGGDCWSCCGEMYIAKPGERDSGRIASRRTVTWLRSLAEYQYVKPNPDGDGWVITQKGTGKVLSHHDTEEKAKAAFRAMESHMHASRHQADIDRAGDRTCAACGHHGAPTMGDTAPTCSRCGSYSLHRNPLHVQRDNANARGDAARYKDQGDYTITSKRRVEATQFERNLARSDGQILIQPGESIRLPTGFTTTVRNIRRHETSGDHYYVDTDMGTSVMPWSTKLQVVPSDTQQQPSPGYADPRGNANQHPGNPSPFKGPEHASEVLSDTCPVCGGKTMRSQGTKDKCTRCGYTQTNAGGPSFSDSPQMIKPHSVRSAVARRATEVAEMMKETL